MRCYICNNILLSREIVINKQGKSEPCFNCLNSSDIDDNDLFNTEYEIEITNRNEEDETA